MRRLDRSMVNMPNIDQFLFDIQNNGGVDGRIYSAYRDKLFSLTRYITRAHYGDLANPLTRLEELENNIMNAVRIPIEHAFTVVCNRQRICSEYNEMKLGQEHPHAKKLLVVAYLLSNICVTLQGSQVGGASTFFCTPPSLEEYLDLGDESDLF